MRFEGNSLAAFYLLDSSVGFGYNLDGKNNYTDTVDVASLTYTCTFKPVIEPILPVVAMRIYVPSRTFGTASFVVPQEPTVVVVASVDAMNSNKRTKIMGDNTSCATNYVSFETMLLSNCSSNFFVGCNNSEFFPLANKHSFHGNCSTGASLVSPITYTIKSIECSTVAVNLLKAHPVKYFSCELSASSMANMLEANDLIFLGKSAHGSLTSKSSIYHLIVTKPNCCIPLQLVNETNEDEEDCKITLTGCSRGFQGIEAPPQTMGISKSCNFETAAVSDNEYSLLSLGPANKNKARVLNACKTLEGSFHGPELKTKGIHDVVNTLTQLESEFVKPNNNYSISSWSFFSETQTEHELIINMSNALDLSGGAGAEHQAPGMGPSPSATELKPADKDFLSPCEAHMDFNLGSCEASAAARLEHEEHDKGLLSNGVAEVRGLHRHPFVRRIRPEEWLGWSPQGNTPMDFLPSLKGRPIGATVTIPR